MSNVNPRLKRLRQAFPQGVHFGVRKRFPKFTMVGLNDLIDGWGIDAVLLDFALSLVRIIEMAAAVVGALGLGGYGAESIPEEMILNLGGRHVIEKLTKDLTLHCIFFTVRVSTTQDDYPT